MFGMPWQETGIYEVIKLQIQNSQDGQADGCKTIEDIIKRYENLDRIYAQIKSEGRLRSSEEVDPNFEWMKHESIVHIGLKGVIHYGCGGIHRFAIAHILKLPFPARIGLVHAKGLPYLSYYRNREVSQVENNYS